MGISGTSFGQLDETIPSDGGFIVWEQEQDYSRETAQLEAGQSVAAGQVVGLVTASSEVKGRDVGAGDGSEVAYGIAIYAVDNTAGVTAKQMAILSGDAIVNEKMVSLVTGATLPADLDSAKTELGTKGFKFRDAPVRTKVYPL